MSSGSVISAHDMCNQAAHGKIIQFLLSKIFSYIKLISDFTVAFRHFHVLYFPPQRPAANIPKFTPHTTGNNIF
jgi:hypothetical protein